MCRLLGVSRSGYSAWRRRPARSSRAQADAVLERRISEIHKRSRGTYGRPRIHAELASQGVRVGGKRIARLMRRLGLAGVSRRIVGWSMATDLRSELVLGALDMALGQRRPRGVIHHSDQGCQYTSLAFGLRCKEAGVRPSMGSVGDCYDNAMCESFFATLECELLGRTRFRTHVEARSAIFEFIEGWYNPRRRHSALGYESPMSYERKFAPVTAA